MRRGFKTFSIPFLSLLLAFSFAHAQESKGLAPGWLSLDGSVGLIDKNVADAKAPLEKALGIGISGFLDTSYTWSSNRPGFGNDDDISLRVFDKDHNEIVFNHLNLTLEKPEKDLGVGLKLVADLGRTAELLREGTFWGRRLQPEPSAELREAFVTTTVPVGEGLQVKGGLFVTLLGTEIIANPGAYNDNISRSYLFGFAIPFRHLGVLLSYPIHKTLSITAGPVTGWDNPRDNNNQPSFLGGITFTPMDKFSLASSLVVGPEQNNRSGPKRLAWANVFTIKPMDPLTLLLEYTYGHEEKATASLRDATWQGLGGIASYAWTDRFSTALRGETFKDSDGVRLTGGALGVAKDVLVSELTLTGAYKFTEKLLGRIELRQDWADERVFQKGNTRSDKNQTTLALQVIYTF
ncbi:MAG: porin [Deltaproteobacteria bacterium]|nr:porin [Deltaproteobacteria bacterium]